MDSNAFTRISPTSRHGITEQFVAARRLPLLKRGMFTAEPSDVTGYLGRDPRTVGEMARRNLLWCKRLPEVLGRLGALGLRQATGPSWQVVPV